MAANFQISYLVHYHMKYVGQMIGFSGDVYYILIYIMIEDIQYLKCKH